MVYPCIEVTVATVGNHTVEDESSEDGKKYMTAFHAAATTIPGCSRGCWGRSDKYPDKVIHFLGKHGDATVLVETRRLLHCILVY